MLLAVSALFLLKYNVGGLALDTVFTESEESKFQNNVINDSVEINKLKQDLDKNGVVVESSITEQSNQIDNLYHATPLPNKTIEEQSDEISKLRSIANNNLN